eukprot:TRINITY_DN68436_c0_g1_i1.p1 TRINITY_DN68436_c0_g1~~TRINITY_DN68436_c0_g1_i1.p1  ORF type:complete len:144 (-),score=20.88 TRINITY_DN68436_c0_g1_i1:372-803(-)
MQVCLAAMASSYASLVSSSAAPIAFCQLSYAPRSMHQILLASSSWWRSSVAFIARSSMVSMFDPGKVTEKLESLEGGMDDEQTAVVFEELRKIPPKVKVIAEAYHTERSGSGDNETRSTVIDHTEKADFEYASWKDASGHVAG